MGAKKGQSNLSFFSQNIVRTYSWIEASKSSTLRL